MDSMNCCASRCRHRSPRPTLWARTRSPNRPEHCWPGQNRAHPRTVHSHLTLSDCCIGTVSQGDHVLKWEGRDVFIKCKVHDPLKCVHTRPTKSGVKPSISATARPIAYVSRPARSPPSIACSMSLTKTTTHCEQQSHRSQQQQCMSTPVASICQHRGTLHRRER